MCALLDVSKNTAVDYLQQIRDEYGIVRVTKWHLMEWLCLDWYALEISWQVRINKNEKKAMEIVELRNQQQLESDRPLFMMSHLIPKIPNKSAIKTICIICSMATSNVCALFA